MSCRARLLPSDRVSVFEGSVGAPECPPALLVLVAHGLCLGEQGRVDLQDRAGGGVAVQKQHRAQQFGVRVCARVDDGSERDAFGAARRAEMCRCECGECASDRGRVLDDDARRIE